VLTVDVVKMYRQVLISSEHRFQYIFWRNHRSESLQTYVLKTVTYSTAEAPHIAIRSMVHLANQFENDYSTGAGIIKSSFYVDDIISGANSVVELRQIQEVTKILGSAISL